MEHKFIFRISVKPIAFLRFPISNWPKMGKINFVSISLIAMGVIVVLSIAGMRNRFTECAIMPFPIPALQLLLLLYKKSPRLYRSIDIHKAILKRNPAYLYQTKKFCCQETSLSINKYAKQVISYPIRGLSSQSPTLATGSDSL